jgi:hypothetical protein
MSLNLSNRFILAFQCFLFGLKQTDASVKKRRQTCHGHSMNGKAAALDMANMGTDEEKPPRGLQLAAAKQPLQPGADFARRKQHHMPTARDSPHALRRQEERHTRSHYSLVLGAHFHQQRYDSSRKTRR